MGEVTLASGIRVNLSPEPMLRFASEEWPYYDGILDRDPDRILPEDVLATVAMNAFPYSATAERIRNIHRGLARACDRLLAEIPVEADIRTYDLDNVMAIAVFDAACAVRGVLLPVATKVLHRKRRSWIPMLDTVVNHGYLDTLRKTGLKSRLEDGSRVAGVGAYLMDAFRRDLVGCETELRELSSVLSEQGTPMTDVRILEVAIWHALEPRGYYRS